MRSSPSVGFWLAVSRVGASVLRTPAAVRRVPTGDAGQYASGRHERPRPGIRNALAHLGILTAIAAQMPMSQGYPWTQNVVAGAQLKHPSPTNKQINNFFKKNNNEKYK